MANIFKNIKSSIGQFVLKNAIAKTHRRAQFHNYSSSKSIGVVFNATHQDTYEIARDYIKKLIDSNHQVKALGFVDSKEVLDFYQKNIHFDFFSRKNLNWYGKPNNPNTKEFISSEFDILIDLSIVEDYSIQYIVGLSKAQFKVGSVKKSKNYYDFMIDITQQKTLPFLIQQIDHYIQMIKSN